MVKVALVTNIPAPYRIPTYNRLASMKDIQFHAIFCSEREPNRSWNLPAMAFGHVFLKERYRTVGGRYIHNNPDIFRTLRQIAPDVIVVDGFNPTHLYAYVYAFTRGIKFVPMTDGTFESERSLSWLHRLVRRLVFARADAFVYASQGGRKLYESYGIAPERCFQSHLCIDNEAFRQPASTVIPQYDFVFCGRMEAVKSPLFVLNVAIRVARQLHRKVSILFVGSGQQLEMVKAGVEENREWVDARFVEQAKQEDLPALYQSGRIFLFPTLWDPWGVVANEACAAGLPVIVSKYAGAAGELIVDKQNGYVCDLDINLWAERAIDLLTEPQRWQEFSSRNAAIVNQYNFDAAANGLANACRHATRRPLWNVGDTALTNK